MFRSSFKIYMFDNCLGRPVTEVLNTSTHPPIEGCTYSLICNILDANPMDITEYTWIWGENNDTTDTQLMNITALDRSEHNGTVFCSGRNAPGYGGYGEGFDLLVW